MSLFSHPAIDKTSALCLGIVKEQQTPSLVHPLFRSMAQVITNFAAIHLGRIIYSYTNPQSGIYFFVNFAIENGNCYE